MKNKRIIIKVGSNSITDKNGLAHKRIKKISKDILKLQELGYEVLVVSSGAIASGIKKMGFKGTAKEVADKRALAAIGQCYLMKAWTKALHPSTVAQMLITWNELKDEESKLKAKETLLNLISRKIIAVINENDAIADEEIRFGDNDHLAIGIAKIIHAKRIVLLTDVDGLFEKDPKIHRDAKIIRKISEVNDEVIENASGSKSSFGSGGMLSKILIAKEGLESGIITNILNAKEEGALYSLVYEGKLIGTEFSKD